MRDHRPENTGPYRKTADLDEPEQTPKPSARPGLQARKPSPAQVPQVLGRRMANMISETGDGIVQLKTATDWRRRFRDLTDLFVLDA